VTRLNTEQATATILIVDDDEAVTKTFARMLKLEGFDVWTAVNPEIGLQVAGETQPQAIILDLRMPLLDGVGFLRRLRTLEAHRDTPVAIVTGDYQLEESITNEVRELGAELRYKPMWLDDLLALARDLLKETN
jgi:two-component system response regulator PrrA